jgi:hypothetical protein
LIICAATRALRGMRCAEYAEQLAQMQRQADERAAALSQALDLARESAEIYRVELGLREGKPGPAPAAKRPLRKRPPRKQQGQQR